MKNFINHINANEHSVTYYGLDLLALTVDKNEVINVQKDAALAHRALTLGFKEIKFTGSQEARLKLANIAQRFAAKIL